MKPTIDALNAEIVKLTAARDALQVLQAPGRVRTIKAVASTPKKTAQKTAQKKTPTPSADEAKRKKWAEAKRLQRKREKAGAK